MRMLARSRLALVLLIALTALVSAARAGAQARGGGEQRSEARERWERMSPEKKARMRERYERLQRMDAAQRQRLGERAARLNQMRRRLYESLDEKTRARLDKLPPNKHLEILDEMVAAEARRAGARILDKLAPDERARVERAGPAERRRMLQEHRREQDARLRKAIQTLAPRLGITPQEMARIKALPPEQRRSTMLALIKRRIERTVDSQGLPEGLNERDWKRLRDLETEEFFAAVMRLREANPDFGRTLLSDRGDRQRRSDSWALRQALRPSPADHVELAHLSRADRMAEMQKRRRGRALAIIRQRKLLSPQEIRALEALHSDRFFARVRELSGAGDARRPGGQQRDGRRRQDGQRPQDRRRPQDGRNSGDGRRQRDGLLPRGCGDQRLP